MTAFVCVHGASGAALRVHGFFTGMHEAQQYVARCAADQTDVQSYIVEQCMRWLPVTEPVRGTGEEEEEIRAPENDDAENGRMGSVCDLIRPSGGAPPPPPPD